MVSINIHQHICIIICISLYILNFKKEVNFYLHIVYSGISESLQQSRISAQLAYIEDVLSSSIQEATAKANASLPLWTLIMGHYPVYSSSTCLSTYLCVVEE